MSKLYSDLDPRTELEQRVTADVQKALAKRGAAVTHHGTPAMHAPSTAAADITIEWQENGKPKRLLLEVAKRSDESEFTSIVEHLNKATALEPGTDTNVLYSGLSTSVRMARFLRNENQRREKDGTSGRIIFLPLNRLQGYLEHWSSAPASAYPLAGISEAIKRWPDFATDLAAAQMLQSELFPDWADKRQELDLAQLRELAIRQERLRRDIVVLENKLRERGTSGSKDTISLSLQYFPFSNAITGQRAHKFLIYLFFIALYEDKKGPSSRATLSGFAEYKNGISPADRADVGYKDRTIHHLVSKDTFKRLECSTNTKRLTYLTALIYSYAWVRSVDGRVRPKGPQDLKYEARDLREIKTGDILVSGIDAVRGAIGVVGQDCDGLVVSKEFFVFRIKDEMEPSVDAEYLVRILRSPKMRAILEGTITGVSNRTRMESPSELLKVPIAPLPSLVEQQKISQKVHDAFKAQDDVLQVFAAIDDALSTSATPT